MAKQVTITGGLNTINGCTWMNNYRDLKSKFKIMSDDSMYRDMATNVLLLMFEHDEKIFRPELFELILHDFGMVALIETDTAKYTPVIFVPVNGERYADGFFKDCVCFDMIAREYIFTDWRNNNNILVFFNNNTITPDNFIDRHAAMLTDVDISLQANVKFSRKKPVPIARDKKVKNQIDQIFSDLDNGEQKTVIADLNLGDFAGSMKPIDVLNLTEVESSKYIQYLSNLHDNLISRLFFHMGLSISDNGKQAQISIEELNKNKSASLAVCLPWYEARKRGFEDAKRKTGEEWKFDFSLLWRKELEQQTATDNVEEQSSEPQKESEQIVEKEVEDEQQSNDE